MLHKNDDNQNKKQSDIAKLKRELAITKANAKAIFTSIGDGIIATDTNGRITQINHVALNILGYTEKELLGKWFSNSITAKNLDNTDIDLIDRPITRAIMSMRPIRTKLLFIRKDGSEVIVAITASPIVYKGKPLGAIELFRDISTEYEIDKMKDDFISIASHQLRTPATGVKQYIAMVMEGYAGEINEAQEAMLAKAYISNDRQLSIVDDLLRIAQLDSGQIQLLKTKVQIPELITDIVREQASKLESRQQTVKLIWSQQANEVYMDEPRMRMVIENLLDNASKYSPDKTEITIQAVRKKKYIEIWITDQGIGVAKSDIDKLFAKFTRIYNPQARDIGGNGLGLYWSKRIVDLHDGHIKVSSILGKGTTFSICLPDIEKKE